jgi:hypothetical protein
MNASKILYYYNLISKNKEMSEEVLRSLSDFDSNALPEIYDNIDLNDPFHIAEIKKLELPPDFVESVYCLSEKEFWDCYRYNTFKPFKRLSLLKTYPKMKNPSPRILRIHGGYNYKNTIYANRYHLLYINRIALLPNMQFINTKESHQIIQKYKDILQIMEYIDQEHQKLNEYETNELNEDEINEDQQLLNEYETNELNEYETNELNEDQQLLNEDQQLKEYEEEIRKEETVERFRRKCNHYA